MTEAVGQQMSGLLGPAAHIVEGEVVTDSTPALGAAPTPKKSRKKKATSPKPTADSNASGNVTALDWVHDASKWGVPAQNWVTAKKAMWLLWVVKQELNTSELNARIIEATFNKHFKQSGMIATGNINRDLGRLKIGKEGKPSLVSEDTTTNPPTWFLTQEGDKVAQGLVVKALGKSADGG